MKILFIASDPQNTCVIQSNTKHNTDMDVYFYKLVNGFIFFIFSEHTFNMHEEQGEM